ncbi:hypothetical protein LZ31DRAFT_372615 [Colletotrichum somersetense]|nr:hypothetical protein LZ31DRAFT_372615 [Colletotrichum somersetense]
MILYAASCIFYPAPSFFFEICWSGVVVCVYSLGPLAVIARFPVKSPWNRVLSRIDPPFESVNAVPPVLLGQCNINFQNHTPTLNNDNRKNWFRRNVGNQTGRPFLARNPRPSVQRLQNTTGYQATRWMRAKTKEKQ